MTLVSLKLSTVEAFNRVQSKIKKTNVKKTRIMMVI